jgi:hypothetical protein
LLLLLLQPLMWHRWWMALAAGLLAETHLFAYRHDPAKYVSS